MSEKTWKIINIISLFIIFVAFLCLTKLLSYSCIMLDDPNVAIYVYMKSFIKHPYNGIYIASSLDWVFALLLPKILHIHPSDFKSIYFPFIEISLIFMYIFLWIKNLYVLNQGNKELKRMYWSVFLFFFLLLLFFITQQPVMILFVYDGFFRMLLPAFLWVALFYFLNKYENKSDIIKLCLIAFLCCISNEMICITTIVGILVYSIIQFVTKNKKDFYKLLLVFISCMVGFLIMIKTGAFVRKSETYLLNMDYIINIIKDVPVFLIDYVKYIFIRHSVEYLIIIAEIITLLKKLRRTN